MKIVISDGEGPIAEALAGELRALGATVLDSCPESGPILLVSLSQDRASAGLDRMTLEDFRDYLDQALDRPWQALKSGLGLLAGRADAVMVHVVMEGQREGWGKPNLRQAVQIMLRSAVLECGTTPRLNLVQYGPAASFRELAATILYLGAPTAGFVTGMTVSIGDDA